LSIYIQRIRKGLIDVNAKHVIQRRRANVLIVDACNGLGQVASWRVLDELIPLARSQSIASATICNSQHFGAVSYYCNRCADLGMILLAMTNCEPAMAPTGGSESFFGTNPIAASFPTGKGFNIKVDLSSSVVARGRVIAAAKSGEAIPDHWALDRKGNATTDASEALLGTILTMAGHKGYALALLVEIFAGVLSGAAIGPAVGSMYKDLDRKQGVGHFFCLLDINAFMDLDKFKQRLDQTIDQIMGGRKRLGFDEILVPGERSFRMSQQSLRQGIPLSESTVKELKALCKELRVNWIAVDGEA
jgi:LDH2 family malate/lactate/ureidoglycolate dehydrogenase